MLQVQNLSKRFGGSTAVEDLSFTVNAGEIVGLLGPNGAGKTTSIRCIASLLQPTSGRILLNGHDVAENPVAAKRALAFVPEVPNPYEMLTVMEHLRFVAAAYRMEDELKNAEEILTRLDLWEKRNELGASLSKGMRQKLACACAFIHQAQVFLFDEPLIGLDPKGMRELKSMIMERRSQGNAILISTHMLDTAERLCDRVVILNRGRLIAEGTVEELHQKLSSGADVTLEDMFLQLTEEVPA
ncbi:ABC transporter ATP-binding protein [Fimbriimonas ginsengisoli]|uniref:ABC transporter, ATP-binding protein n=1 Tax=Fimbriimonas ginsengisoli Gsoil 348 TaxID=661478 RepID=A0A068NQB7_FIMGI|nr:ABC transporter ATP-binding protein [Fimbriimonas ginsengisoli]AIE84950.1 ABC transporter, ATP-binding protein [Fimbriimonas ginsengisoli Gsoil 348]